MKRGIKASVWRMPFRFVRVFGWSVRQSVFPIEMLEPVLFILFFGFYAWLGNLIAGKTDLLEDVHGGSGSYLGYDNLYQLYADGGKFDVLHPLFNGFHLLKELFVYLADRYLSVDIRAGFSLAWMNVLVSGGLVCLYRYLKKLVLLPTRRALLLTCLAGCSFTTVVLSFTVGAYPFSFFLLLFSLLALSGEYRRLGFMRGTTLAVFSFLLGGVTITNALKPLFLSFLFVRTWKLKYRVWLSSVLPLLGCIIVLFVVYKLKDYGAGDLPVEPAAVQDRLVVPFSAEAGAVKNWLDTCWGNTFMTTPLSAQWFGSDRVLFPTAYLQGWQYVVPLLLLFLSLASVVLNLRNRYVWILAVYGWVDVCQFCMTDSSGWTVLGAHWLFLVPMLLGWLYKRLPVRYYRMMDWTLVLLTACMLTLNSLEFFRLGNSLME